MKKLRLVTTLDCYRFCEGCCNHDWDWSKVPVCRSFVGYDEIFLTGGEPMIYVHSLAYLIGNIRGVNPQAKVYLYTADVNNYGDSAIILSILDGMTVTLHENKDVARFTGFVNYLKWMGKPLEDKSLRLNVFKKVTDKRYNTPEISSSWKIKDEIEWILQCPLPEGEIMMKLPGV